MDIEKFLNENPVYKEMMESVERKTATPEGAIAGAILALAFEVARLRTDTCSQLGDIKSEMVNLRPR